MHDSHLANWRDYGQIDVVVPACHGFAVWHFTLLLVAEEMAVHIDMLLEFTILPKFRNFEIRSRTVIV